MQALIHKGSLGTNNNFDWRPNGDWSQYFRPIVHSIFISWGPFVPTYVHSKTRENDLSKLDEMTGFGPHNIRSRLTPVPT